MAAAKSRRNRADLKSIISDWEQRANRIVPRLSFKEILALKYSKQLPPGVWYASSIWTDAQVSYATKPPVSRYLSQMGEPRVTLGLELASAWSRPGLKNRKMVCSGDIGSGIR